MPQHVDELDTRQARIARNEAAFRETNEQIDALNAAGAQLPAFQIVCECGSHSCLETFTVAVGEYEAVRAHGDRFLLKAGHDASDVESVVERHGTYVVVAKNAGAPAAIARATDPRADSPVTDDETARRIAENESRFRDANEQIEAAVLRHEADASTLPFVCECGRPRCMRIIRLSVDEYERVRVDSRYFLCAPGHEIVGENIGRVIRENDTYVVFEKLGAAGEVAAERDPRAVDAERA
jgi:hypothetical protein